MNLKAESSLCFCIGGPRFSPRVADTMISKRFLKLGIIVYYNKKIRSKKNKKNFMVPFYGWDSIASRLQSHFEETVNFLPLSSQD